ncbi:MAG TPA: acylphosphatase [Candidatus Ruania gallistercoris]|uniref:Acylphosphatase n=1 Tax=Candidatus Ruania gallistercoris TaxID=2838746 RepID=A0A9D2ECI7_9MICO|nr:acylphosphatase [Candidatus Ruania gallistercoris]
MARWRQSQQPAPVTARRVVVSGVVQGVGFRAATVRRAREAGVAGWVRNRADGRVDAWAEGSGDAVTALVDWLGEGPRHAAVAECEVTEEQPQGYRSFEIDR